MTTPTIFSDIYGDANALQRAPALYTGAPAHVRVTTTLPAGTATTVVAGLIPFAKGAKVCMRGSSIKCGDGDTATTATLDIGWVYDDNTTYTNDPNGFIAATAAPQTGAVAAFDAVAGYSFVAEAPGWIMCQPGGETVEVEYTVIADVLISYN